MDENKYPRFIPAVDLNWRGVLKGVTKATDPYQPLYEALCFRGREPEGIPLFSFGFRARF